MRPEVRPEREGEDNRAPAVLLSVSANEFNWPEMKCDWRKCALG